MENMQNNNAEFLQPKKEMYDVANEAARARINPETNLPYENVNEFVSQKQKAYNAGGSKATIAQQEVQQYLGDMLMLTLYQIIEKPQNLDKIREWAHKFDDGKLAAGNQRIYVNNLITGHTDWLDVQGKFVPDKATYPKSEWKGIYFYKDDEGNLADGAFQWVKNQTIRAAEWIPFFTSGALNEFIAQVQSGLYRSWLYYKYDQTVSYVINQANSFKRQVAGKGTDMFESVNEFLEEISEMKEINSIYNIGGAVGKPDAETPEETKSIRYTRTEDLVVIMSPRNKTKLQAGIETQLFNAELLNLNGVIDMSNITTFGGKLVIGDEKTPVTVSETRYIDNNTIIVFDKAAFRFLYYVEQNGVQSYPHNMTLQLTNHVWGVMGYLPWYQGFKYSNVNLSKLPSSKTAINTRAAK